jgi:PHD/YefM family antitoxin component YafN of YafNO toxin-antitoxin module
MKSVNALQIRKSLGSVLKTMEQTKEPVLVTRDREPVAALIPMAIFRQRFVDFLSDDALRKAMDDLRELQSYSRGPDSLQELRRLREAGA